MSDAESERLDALVAGQCAGPSSVPGRGYRSTRCDGCGLTCTWCVCGELPRLQHQVALDIVVHWRELSKPTNTARLAQRMLKSVRLLVRGGPDSNAGREVTARLSAHAAERTWLLYPSDGARPLRIDAATERPLALIVPDGTWAQTRRLVRRYELGRFQAVCLPPLPSRYVLRRGVRPGEVCTIEAIAGAFDLLERPGAGDALRAGFELWQQRALMIRRGAPVAPRRAG